MAELTEGGTGAVFVLTSPLQGQLGPLAAWISTAGLATAAAEVWGPSSIVTPEGVLTPTEARMRASAPTLRSGGHRWRRTVPATLKTAATDVNRLIRSRRFRADIASLSAEARPRLIWQRHEAFSDAGVRLHEELGVPLVVSVPAPVTWEAQQWGVRRPGWNTLFRYFGERPSLVAADLVACGSELVAEVIADFGIDTDRIVVMPSAADTGLFRPDASGGAVRSRLGLEGRFVVGWCGSFRPFHRLDLAVEAVAELDRRVRDVSFLFVGDGAERDHVERLCRAAGIDAVFTGTVRHIEVPDHLAAMDAAVLPAGITPFHYSPLKLWEYMASGRAIVAAAVGQHGDLLTDEVDALLIPPEDPDAMADALQRLYEDEELRRTLQKAAAIEFPNVIED